jgi:hypothetical protein
MVAQQMVSKKAAKHGLGSLIGSDAMVAAICHDSTEHSSPKNMHPLA